MRNAGPIESPTDPFSSVPLPSRATSKKPKIEGLPPGVSRDIFGAPGQQQEPRRPAGATPPAPNAPNGGALPPATPPSQPWPVNGSPQDGPLVRPGAAGPRPDRPGTAPPPSLTAGHRPASADRPRHGLPGARRAHVGLGPARHPRRRRRHRRPDRDPGGRETPHRARRQAQQARRGRHRRRQGHHPARRGRPPARRGDHDRRGAQRLPHPLRGVAGADRHDRDRAPGDRRRLPARQDRGRPGRDRRQAAARRARGVQGPAAGRHPAPRRRARRPGESGPPDQRGVPARQRLRR